MWQIGVQTKNVIDDSNPKDGFEMLRRAGFSCADFSLNSYLLNTSLYKFELNDFFNKSVNELEAYFQPHKELCSQWKKGAERLLAGCCCAEEYAGLRFFRVSVYCGAWL